MLKLSKMKYLKLIEPSIELEKEYIKMFLD